MARIHRTLTASFADAAGCGRSRDHNRAASRRRFATEARVDNPVVPNQDRRYPARAPRRRPRHLEDAIRWATASARRQAVQFTKQLPVDTTERDWSEWNGFRLVWNGMEGSQWNGNGWKWKEEGMEWIGNWKWKGNGMEWIDGLKWNGRIMENRTSKAPGMIDLAALCRDILA